MNEDSARRPFLGPNPWRTAAYALLIITAVVAVFAVLYNVVPGYRQQAQIGLAEITGQNRMPDDAFRGRIIVRDDTRYLWGGRDPEQDFDISTFRLNPNWLRYGLGRERFPALIEPEFVPADNADTWMWPEARVLLVESGDEARVYPLTLLRRHEVVNDEINGEPIFAAYCLLADLGAVYDRRLGDEVLTFGVSGYTYSDPEVWDGMNAFVLWDRDTESLWWPPIGKAVSGPLVDVPLRLYDESKWSQTTWADVIRTHPQAKVLEPDQDFKRPSQWRELEVSAMDLPRLADDEPVDDEAVAPRWGANDRVGQSRATTQPATTQPATTQPDR